MMETLGMIEKLIMCLVQLLVLIWVIAGIFATVRIATKGIKLNISGTTIQTIQKVTHADQSDQKLK